MSPNRARSLMILGSPLFLLLLGAVQKPPQMSTHEKAARELVQLVGADRLAREGAESMLATIPETSETAVYKEVSRAWYEKLFADQDFESEMVRLYMDRFSEKELLEITAFYKTPAGRKAIDTLPELMRLSATYGLQKAQEHASELEEMVAKAREEHENQPAANDADAQKRTIAQIRNTGTAMFSWLTDQIGAAAAGQSQMPDDKRVRLDSYPALSRDELQEILVPQYIQTVPEKDGWGNSYEYFLNTENPLEPNVMTIRSAGRDGRFSGIEYTVTSFDPKDFDEDIVWSDGFFVRWPERKPEK
jgi:hypothetical protein